MTYKWGAPGRGPAHFLVGFEARLQTDGYAAYGKIGGPGLLHFECWAHVRRKFTDASKLDVRDARSVAVVAIGMLYELERVAREGGLIPTRNDNRSVSAPKGQATRSPWQRRGVNPF